MKKCLWYISKYIAPPFKSGVGSRGYHLMEEMTSLDVESIIITSDSNHLTEIPKLINIYSSELINNVIIIWIKTFKYKIAKSFKRIISWIDFEIKLFFLNKKNLPKPDAIIISSLSLLTIINGYFLKKKYNCKLILEIRDIWPLTIVEAGGYSKKNLFVRILSIIEKFGYEKSDLIVGTMPNLSEHITNVLGYAKETICIPMGYNESSLKSQKDIPDGYIKHYFPKEKFIVAYAGTIGITNALDTFFECAINMVNYPNIHFLMIGDGALKSYYQNKYCNLKNLTFAPNVLKQEVQSALYHCNLLYFSVYKSKVWQYGQSLNKIIDYMFAGKPILASYTGFRSMINEANSGSYVPANDINALKDEILRYSTMNEDELYIIGKRGRDWIINKRHYKTLANKYFKAIF